MGPVLPPTTGPGFIGPIPAGDPPPTITGPGFIPSTGALPSPRGSGRGNGVRIGVGCLTGSDVVVGDGDGGSEGSPPGKGRMVTVPSTEAWVTPNWSLVRGKEGE